MSSSLALDKFDATSLKTVPFEYVVVRDFIHREALDAARRDYPAVPSAGSHPPAGLKIDGGFKRLVDDIHGPAFQQAIERKFQIDLTGRPLMYTVRGHCRARDGQIHTDTKSKIITVLLYLNDDQWNSESGRLRLLRNGSDLNDYAEEVEPAGGTLLVFKRSDHSWHGHTSFAGPRRALQFNWVTDQSVVDREQNRHGVSAFFKKLLGRDTVTM
jgi:SM-20-related protein